MTESPSTRPIRASWYAVAALYGLTVVGATLVVLVGTQIEFCVTGLGCGPEDDDDGWLLVGLLLALIAVLSAPVVGAKLSGWNHPIVAGLIALLTSLGVFAVIAVLSDGLFDAIGPAFVAGLAAEGSIAVRPPSRRAFRGRLLAASALVLVAAVLTAADADDVVTVPALLAFAAVAVADTVANRSERTNLDMR